MRKITAVATPGQDGKRYQVGVQGLLRLEMAQRGGQMGYVPWIRAHYEDGSTVDLNVALLEYIEAEGEEEDS